MAEPDATSTSTAPPTTTTVTASSDPDKPKTIEELKQEAEKIENELDNETDNTTLLAAQLQQNRMIEKTQQAMDRREFRVQIEEYEEMAEEIIDTLYDYEEKLENYGIFVPKSAAEAFEDAKDEVQVRHNEENSESSLMPEKLKELIQTINTGGSANLKLAKAAEIAAHKTKYVTTTIIFVHKPAMWIECDEPAEQQRIIFN